MESSLSSIASAAEAGPARARLGTAFAAIIALTVWYGLALQFWVLVRTTGGWISATRSFFSFFTILTNLIVAVVVTVPLLWPSRVTWFQRAEVRSATAVYIALVGIVYSLILRELWNPQGQQAVADFLLHDAVPLLYVIYWLVFVPKGSLRVSRAPRWLIYPLTYCGLSLARSAMTGWYAYPFLNAAALGYPRVLVNVAVLILGLFALSCAAIGIDKALARTP